MTTKPQAKMFSTRVKAEVLKEIKHLSVDLEKPISELVEEALKDLIEKYLKKTK